MAMDKKRIQSSDVKVGEPLKWPVFDSSGVLLLRKGYVISTQSQLDSLLSRGLFLHKTAAHRPVAEGPSVKISPFHIFDNLQVRLKRVCDDMHAGNLNDIPGRVSQIGLVIQKMCQMDADAMIGAIHLIHDGHYTILHSLHAAILSEIFLRSLGISAEDRLPILAAAITKDVGMMDLQDTLHKQNTPLTPEQHALVRTHPLRSVELLEKSGVRDGIWLEAVRHHHERLDGSGYPDGIEEEDIFFPVRILALVDIYSAMIKRRAYRDSLKSRDAMREIFTERASEVDAHLTKLFIKELGLFPPGVFVKLRNSEIAVVTHRGKQGTVPIVQAVIGPRGAPLIKAQKRDTTQEDFAIRELVPRDHQVAINLHSLWGYN